MSWNYELLFYRLKLAIKFTEKRYYNFELNFLNLRLLEKYNS